MSGRETGPRTNWVNVARHYATCSSDLKSRQEVSRSPLDLRRRTAGYHRRPGHVEQLTKLSDGAIALEVQADGVFVASVEFGGGPRSWPRDRTTRKPSRIRPLPPASTPAATEGILGLDFTISEDGARWLTLFRNLTARGMSAVKLVKRNAYPGLVAASGVTLGGAG